MVDTLVVDPETRVVAGSISAVSREGKERLAGRAPFSLGVGGFCINFPFQFCPRSQRGNSQRPGNRQQINQRSSQDAIRTRVHFKHGRSLLRASKGPTSRFSRGFSVCRSRGNWNYFPSGASVCSGDDREPIAQPFLPFLRRLAKSRCGRPPSHLQIHCSILPCPEKSLRERETFAPKVGRKTAGRRLPHNDDHG